VTLARYYPTIHV